MNYTTHFFYEDCSEFEELRQIVLSDETNPNKNDFTHEKLIIEDHDGYAVVFIDEKPAAMSGLYPIRNYDGVGRIMNRHYIFPEFRMKSRKDCYTFFKVLADTVFKPLLDKSPYDTHIMSMKNRGERNNFFNTFYSMHDKSWPNHWYRIQGYVQTGNGMKRDSWQNVITDNPDYPFKTLNHDQWLLLP
jgi:hypothetical protein